MSQEQLPELGESAKPDGKVELTPDQQGWRRIIDRSLDGGLLTEEGLQSLLKQFGLPKASDLEISKTIKTPPKSSSRPKDNRGSRGFWPGKDLK